MSNEKSWSIVTPEIHELFALAPLFTLYFGRLMFARLQKFFANKSSLARSIVLFSLLFPPLLILVAGISLAVWVVPNIERYHPFIELQASRAIGSPIKIKKIEADWRGVNPRLYLENIRILDAQGMPVLTLKKVESVVSWRTLFFGELRLQSLSIAQPSLSVRRDANGVLSVEGIKIDQQENSDGADWLLRQGHITVSDAHLSWLDESRNSAILPFEKVNIELENHGRHHLFLVTATPPAFLSAPLEMHGKLIGRHFAEVKKWQGEIEAKLTHFDAMAWSYWLPVPPQISRANGDLHAWLTADETGLRKLSAEVAVRDVEHRFAENLPPLKVDQIKGHLVWQELSAGFELSAKQLSFTLADGFSLPATDFSFRQQAAQGKRAAETALQISTIDLASSQRLLPYLPLETSLKQQIIDANPQGRLRQFQLSWFGQLQDLKRYQLGAKFEALALRQVDDKPGFSGLTGAVSANEKQGYLTLAAPGLSLNAPHFLLSPLTFERFIIDADWQKQATGWKFRLNNAQMANADLDGTASGSYLSDGKGFGVADVSLQLTRASVKQVARYIPLHSLGDETQAWLQKGLLSGEASQFSLKLKGDLDQFPFAENRGGLFQIAVKAHDVGIEYQEKWPRIEKANVDLLIEGRRLQVTADKAVIGTGEVQNVSVILPDMLSNQLSLIVRGESTGATQHALNYINNSPLRAALRDFTKDIKAAGDGKLSLLLNIPLSGSEDIKVQGAYHFVDNEVDLGKFIPTLKKVNGDLTFTEAALTVKNISVQALGGPARISVATEADGRLNVLADGRINAENLPATVPLGVLKHLYGSTAWNTKVSTLGDDLSVIVESDLLGLGMDLPSPFAKNRHENVPVHFEMRNLSATKDQFSLRYGKSMKATFTRQIDAQGNWPIKRGSIAFGAANANPQLDREGIWITGMLPFISVQDWLATGLVETSVATHGQLPPIAGIDLLLRKVTIFNSDLNEFSIRGQTNNGLLKAQLASTEVNGELQWQAQGDGRLQLRLKDAAIGNATNPLIISPSPPPTLLGLESLPLVRKINLPTIDVAVEQFSYQRKPLGKLEFHLSQKGGDVLLDHLRMSNPDGSFVANGKWDLNSAQSHMNFKLDILDAGKVLDRSGFPGAVKDAKGVLRGDFLWSGGPDEFESSKLSGTLNLKVEKGQFLKINPGAGKLLSVLNLQALPKRVTLDFTDVFSGGFEFDNIEATAHINQGVLVTKDLKIEGSAASVQMAGQVDLKRETQNLRVRISPKLSNTVSLIAFAGGPVVGAGVLLASKVLSDPLDKLTSFEYNITGNWADPSVDKVSAAARP
jgi:uncharacterized protein (TIGR02099 family)